MDGRTVDSLREWAATYNDMRYFEEDPIIFPRKMYEGLKIGRNNLADIEIAAIISSHLAWGRRSMIVRDCTRVFEQMDWKPYDYVMRGKYRNDPVSLHRTVKWSELADILGRLRKIYEGRESLEGIPTSCIRTGIFASKEDPKAPNKKINLMKRWMVRRDGKVDLGVWKDTDPATLLIPLDVHVYDQAVKLGLTSRRQKDIVTATEITDCFKDIFPGDPCLGDYALFGFGVTHPEH